MAGCSVCQGRARAMGMGRVVEVRELTGNQDLEGPREHSDFPLIETESHERVWNRGMLWFDGCRQALKAAAIRGLLMATSDGSTIIIPVLKEFKKPI